MRRIFLRAVQKGSLQHMNTICRRLARSSVVIALSVLFVVSGCADGGRLLDPQLGEEPPSDALEVVDTGFSLTGDGGQWLTIGVTIRNPTEFMALVSSVNVSVVDKDGEVVVDSLIDDTIEVLRPGKEIGFGAMEISFDGWKDAEIAEVKVEPIETKEWTAKKSDSDEFLTISTSKPEFGKSTVGLDEITIVAEAHSRGWAENMTYTAIFYDRQKNVVGGCGDDTVMGLSGKSDMELTLYCKIPNDVDHDDIIIFNDYA